MRMKKEVTLTVRKAAYITHFFRKMKGQTLNNSLLTLKRLRCHQPASHNSLLKSLG
jgi:hypothetical protein